MRLTQPPLVKHGIELKSLDRFPGYLFASDGSIWSSHVKGWRKLRPTMGDRYLTVSLTLRYREAKQFSVHSVICEAFCGPRPDGMECRHLDGNCANNAASNLCWGTHSENQMDKHGHGTMNCRENHTKAKLATADVVHVRRLLALGFREVDVARSFKVSQSAIKHIRHRRSWATV